MAAEKAQIGLPVDWPVDRPTVKNSTVEPSGRLPGQPCQNQKATALWPVDRPVDRADTESRALCRSTGSVDRGHFQRVELSGRSTARSTGPPAQAACTSCARRSTRPVDRLLLQSTGPVDRQTARSNFKGLKTWVFHFNLNPIKSHKFHKIQFLLYL